MLRIVGSAVGRGRQCVLFKEEDPQDPIDNTRVDCNDTLAVYGHTGPKVSSIILGTTNKNGPGAMQIHKRRILDVSTGGDICGVYHSR